MTELAERVEELFRLQSEEWPLLARGIAGLGEALTRPVVAEGTEVLLRHIAHRAASTTAKVDPAAIAARPCFLCVANLPPGQRGLEWKGGFTLLCNPFPVVERHLTVVHREHRPQRLDGQVGTLLDLAAELPGHAVLYNGPECGASAPDHLHLQAGAREELPIVRIAGRARGPVVEAYGTRALLFRGGRSRVLDSTGRALARLAEVTGRGPEPWCNVVAWREPEGAFALVLFPRSRHRPEAFHRGELTVSPAAIDLSGVLVAPFRKDYDRLTGEEVAAVFREVTLGAAEFGAVAAGLEAR